MMVSHSDLQWREEVYVEVARSTHHISSLNRGERVLFTVLLKVDPVSSAVAG